MKQIALTFDDGPHTQLTQELMDTALTFKAKLTFFVLGERAAPRLEIIREMIRRGHEVGNHTWSHPDFRKIDDMEIRQQLSKTEDLFIRCGTRPVVMRPPYGEISKSQRMLVESEFGYKVVLWTIDSNDWRTRDSHEIAESIVRLARDGAIVVAHDIHRETIDAMPVVFERLTTAGFEFVTASQLVRRSEIPAPDRARRKDRG